MNSQPKEDSRHEVPRTSAAVGELDAAQAQSLLATANQARAAARADTHMTAITLLVVGIATLVSGVSLTATEWMSRTPTMFGLGDAHIIAAAVVFLVLAALAELHTRRVGAGLGAKGWLLGALVMAATLVPYAVPLVVIPLAVARAWPHLKKLWNSLTGKTKTVLVVLAVILAPVVLFAFLFIVGLLISFVTLAGWVTPLVLVFTILGALACYHRDRRLAIAAAVSVLVLLPAAIGFYENRFYDLVSLNHATWLFHVSTTGIITALLGLGLAIAGLVIHRRDNKKSRTVSFCTGAVTA